MAFIDFASAFDTIVRGDLMECLRCFGVDEKIVGIIEDMYREVIVEIRNNNSSSDQFRSTVGVRQGCKLSPLLFSLYINVLAEKIKETNIGVQLHPGILQICILLFADDIALFADSV